MDLKGKLGLIYFLLPYLSVTKNRFGIVLSILMGNKNYKIELKNNQTISLPSSKSDLLLPLLGGITFATSYSIKSGNKLELSFDMKNKFTISLDNMSYEDENLLKILYYATNYGANFVINNAISSGIHRDKMLKIIQSDKKKIIETSNGIKLFVDSVNPGNTIRDTFVINLHLIASKDDWNNKVVIDVGAECGDTALYYASMGATVYCFEPIKAHFDALMRNLSINPELSKKIVPTNAAVGKDGLLKFYQSTTTEIAGGASFVYNLHSKNVKFSQVKGYSLESVIKEFGIEHIDLLKMDCKGCEFHLTENALKNVKQVKIEYLAFDNAHKLEDLLGLLERAGFDYVIYRQHAFYSLSNRSHAIIYGKKN